MKVELRFGGETNDPRLREFTLEIGSATKPDREPTIRMLQAADDAGASTNDRLFHWQPGVRALSVLLLRAFTRGEPYRGRLEGEARSLASSLYEILSDTKAKDGGPTWIQRMFIPPTSALVDAHRRVPYSLFVRSSHGEPRAYRVELGESWRSAQLAIRLNGARVSPEVAQEMAEGIEADDRRRRSQCRLERLATELTLKVWFPELGACRPIDHCPLPLPNDCEVQLAIRLNRSGYLAVVWRNATGSIQPLFPYGDFNWRGPGHRAELAEVVLPDIHLDCSSGYYPLDRKPGVETVLALASDRPPETSEFLALAKAFSKNQAWFPNALPDPNKLYLISDRRTAAKGRPNTRLGAPQANQEPFAPLVDGILECAGYVFSSITGAAFCTKNANSR